MKKNAKRNLKKWRRKSLALLLSLSMTVTLFSGCSFQKESNKTADKNPVSQEKAVSAQEDITENRSEETASANNVLNRYADTLSKMAELTETISSHAEAGETKQALLTAGQLKQLLSESEKAAGTLAEQTIEIQENLEEKTQKTIQERQNQFNKDQKTFRKKLAHTLDGLLQASGKKQIRRHARKLETLFRQETQDYGDNLPPEPAETGEITTEEMPSYADGTVKGASLPSSSGNTSSRESTGHQTHSEYLKCSGATALTPAIQEKAEELKTPLAVYEYLRNNLDYEYYGGSRKGAAQTLAAMAGNDYDQASLLAAMLRCLGYETRYVKGEIRLDAGMAVSMTGAETAELAAEVFAVSGNNVTILTRENRAEYLQMEHVWVEACVPYTDYRGAGRAEGKSMWIPLDTGIKEYEDIENIYDTLENNGTLEAYKKVLSGSDGEALSAFLDNTMQKAGETVSSAGKQETDKQSDRTAYSLKKRWIKQESAGYLPNSLPYQNTADRKTLAQPEQSDKDQVEIRINGQKAASWNYDRIAEKRITLQYTPAAAEDSEIIHQYGSIFETPAYLVQMVPVLCLDGKAEAALTDCAAALGESQQFDICITSGKQTETITNDVTAGSLYAVLLDSQTVSAEGLQAAYDQCVAQIDTASTENILWEEHLGQILHLAGQMYFAQTDITRGINAQMDGVISTRSLSEGMTGYQLQTLSAGGSVTAVREGCLYIDIDHNAQSAVSLSGKPSDEKQYMLAAGILASRLEASVWEEFTGYESVSTISILAGARERGLDILELRRENIDKEIGRLEGSSELIRDIRTAVSAGNLVLIPETDTQMGEWKGTGYMVIDPESGAGSYMIHGGIVGKASGGSGIFAATLATLYRISSGVLALYGTFGAITALSAMTPLSAGIYVCIAILLVISYFTFEDICDSTVQYLDYLEDGDEEKLAGMVEDALWAGLFDLAVYAGGRVLRKLAESVDLKVKDCTQWPAGGKYSETEIKNILDNIQGSGFKNNPLRQEYESEVRALKSYGEELLGSGMSEEEVARTLNQARRDLGVKYKDMTPQPLRDYIYEINEERYGGDKLGPTYEYMKGEGKSDLEIIKSSSHPNTDIDSLLGDFENWLRRQL